jgi:hypothetical protein
VQPKLYFRVTSPAYDEPLSDGETVFTVRHRAHGDVLRASGVVWIENTTLDAAAAEFPDGTVFTVV